MPKFKIDLKKILFTITAWVIILAVINFLSGFIVKNKYIALEPIDQKTAETTWGYFLPGQDRVLLFPGQPPYKVKTDAMGFRDTGYSENLSIENIQDKYKILALGDSITFGLFVDDEDTYPYRLQQKIHQSGKDAVVLNAGVGSSTVTDYVAYMKQKGLQLKPDLVLLTFCENDLQDLDREKSRYEIMRDENVFDLFETIKLAKFMRMFRKIELAQRYKRWMKKTNDPKLQKILSERSTDLNDVLYSAAFHAEKPGMDPYHDELKEAWQKYFTGLDELVGLLKENKIDFIYIIYPHPVTVFDYSKGYYQDILKHSLAQKGVQYIDLLPFFKERKSQFLELYHNLPRDFHLTGEGAQVLVDVVYDRMEGHI